MILSNATLTSLAVLTCWFALNFVGVANVVDAEPLFSLAGLMLAVLAAVAVAGLMGVRGVALVYSLALLIWAALQIETHWSTYLLFDASERKLAWYESVFGVHWRFLPPIANRTTPDGYHTILAISILTNLAFTARDVVRRG